MEATSLTVSGFNQPAVAQLLIEMPGNNEKELRIKLFPKLLYAEFSTLESTNKEFIGKYNI